MKANQIEINTENKTINITGPYSTSNNNIYRSIGGRWNPVKQCWTVSQSRSLDVERLFGAESEDVEVRVAKAQLGAIHAVVGTESIGGQLQLGGYVLASRYSRDRGADLYADLVVGTIPPSGGSVKHPRVDASHDSVFELTVRRAFAETHNLEIIAIGPAIARHISITPTPILDNEVPATFEGIEVSRD